MWYGADYKTVHDMAIERPVPSLPIENQWGTASWRADKADWDNIAFSLDHGSETLCIFLSTALLVQLAGAT